MGWQDDDFPGEDTDPGRAQAVSATPPSHTGGYVAHDPYGARVRNPQQQYPPQPGQQPYPAQPGAPAEWPMTGQFSGVPPSPLSGSFQQVQPNTGAYPQAPNTGSYQQVPTSGVHQQPTNTGSYLPPLSSSIPVLPAPVVATGPREPASRVIYGLSGTAVGGIVGTLLGVFNCFAEEITITQGTEFIMQSALWFAFLVGVLAFWKPERFDAALERIQAMATK